MKKIYRIITLEGSHEYDIQVEHTDTGKKFTLLYSNSGVWANPGSKILSLEDNDDGTVKLPKLNRKVELHVACDLGILLKFMTKYCQDKFKNSTSYVAIDSSIGYNI